MKKFCNFTILISVFFLNSCGKKSGLTMEDELQKTMFNKTIEGYNIRNGENNFKYYSKEDLTKKTDEKNNNSKKQNKR